MIVTVENFKALNDQVVVLVPKIEEKTAGGITKTPRMIEQEAAQHSKFFKVVGVGTNVTSITVGSYILPGRQLTVIPVETEDDSVNVAVVRVFDIIGFTDQPGGYTEA